MSSNRIEELKKQRQRQMKKKKSQLPYAVVLFVIVLMIYVVLTSHGVKDRPFWLFGLLMGFVLQRSRFCFTSSFRDMILVGSTTILRAILIALIVQTIGFGILQYRAIGPSEMINIANVPGQIYPVGLHTIIGAFIAGIGMVIAGGCVSGTLMRIGEGFTLQLVVLIGLIIGGLLGAKDFAFWYETSIAKSPTIYLPDQFGFVATILGQVAVLGGLYYVVRWYDRKHNIMSE